MAEIVMEPEGIRQYEQHLFIKQNIPSILLMDNAGLCVANAVKQTNVLIICGSGNNGGDGFSAARHLAARGAKVSLLIIKSLPKAGDAKLCYDAAIGSGIFAKVVQNQSEFLQYINNAQKFDAIIDAMFGIGLNKPLEGIYALAVDYINKSDSTVVSVDIPSGIDAKTGKVLGCAVRADITVTFMYKKTGQLLMPGREYCGKLQNVVLCPELGFNHGGMKNLTADDLKLLPKRSINSNKGDFGKALLIAGSPNMAGAAIVCAKAALRTGTGLLTVGVHSKIAPAFWGHLPEAMTTELESKLQVEYLLSGKTCCAIGPGMGCNDNTQNILKELIKESKIPTIIDADGLNCLALDINILKEKQQVILTPHPGEMARLLKCDIATIINSPVEHAVKLSKDTGAVVLLKGATTVIASPDGRVNFNTIGSPKLAKGGSGDILTGIILGLLSQGLSCFDSASVAAVALGTAANMVNKAENSVLATDIIEQLAYIW